MLNNAKGGCKDLPPEIVALFVSFHPYKGGNDTLWALNELWKIPTHKILKPSPAALQGIFLHVFEATLVGDVSVDAPIWKKNEIVMMRAAPDAKLQYDANVAFTVTFNDELDIVRGHEPVVLLRAMAAEVERILVATEAECRRIGIVAP